MDPITIAIFARELTKTALQISSIYSNDNPDKEAQLASYLVDIHENLKRKYHDYDPNLDSDIAALNK